MISPWYTAVEPFDPSSGRNWVNYVEWSGLTQLTEVVSLDRSLCPSAILDIEDEDWKHNVNEAGVIEFFHDLDYLLLRVADIRPVSILAAVRNPHEECREAFPNPRFEFKGYDLIGAGISALTNCGGFPLAFQNDELSGSGLIATLARAQQVRAALRENYPDESHADCDIWALWKMRLP